MLAKNTGDQIPLVGILGLIPGLCEPYSKLLKGGLKGGGFAVPTGVIKGASLELRQNSSCRAIF